MYMHDITMHVACCMLHVTRNCKAMDLNQCREVHGDTLIDADQTVSSRCIAEKNRMLLSSRIVFFWEKKKRRLIAEDCPNAHLSLQECPTAEVITKVADVLSLHANEAEDVFETHARGAATSSCQLQTLGNMHVDL
jgi:hypothetical protein